VHHGLAGGIDNEVVFPNIYVTDFDRIIEGYAFPDIPDNRP